MKLVKYSVLGIAAVAGVVAVGSLAGSDNVGAMAVPASSAAATSAPMTMPTVITTPGTTFVNSVALSFQQLQMQTHNTKATTAFKNSFNAASVTYKNTLVKAVETYVTQKAAYPSGDAARNQLIDSLNNMKSTYFNSLDVAKNKLANSLSGSDAVAKDTFINSYNASRDTFSNQFEELKNAIVSYL